MMATGASLAYSKTTYKGALSKVTISEGGLISESAKFCIVLELKDIPYVEEIELAGEANEIHDASKACNG